MKINKIKRLYEDAMMQMQEPMQQEMPQMQAPAFAQTQMPMDIEASIGGDELEFDPTATISKETEVGAEVSQMTIGDFLQKCKEIDPLVCMGLESFIEKNREAFMMETPAQGEDDFKNIEFGAGEEETMPELEFPMEEPQQM